jgi:catalase
MHAKGSGAYGTFTVTHDISKYTRAALFSEVGKKTDVFLRFSTVAGERGAADAERDIRGFAVKFYTEQGNWDIVGNNTPVFFFRDPLKFPDLNHVVKRDPKTNLRNAENNWDFWTLLPEALHQITIVMSDRGIPKGYRHMHGFGSHTFSFINAANERFWVKFHFVSQQGIENLSDAEAAALIGVDRESSQRDCSTPSSAGIPALETGGADHAGSRGLQSAVPSVRPDQGLAAQGLPADRRRRAGAEPQSGKLLREVEQSAFSPANVVPGVGFSPDKMLQSRLFSYGDAARYRLGVNHHQIPVNAPKCPFHSYHRDGAMRVRRTKAAARLRAQQPRRMGGKPAVQGTAAVAGRRGRPLEPPRRYRLLLAAGALFRLMTAEKKQLLFENTARAIHGVSKAVQQRHIDNCTQADPAYGAGVAAAIAALKASKHD